MPDQIPPEGLADERLEQRLTEELKLAEDAASYHASELERARRVVITCEEALQRLHLADPMDPLPHRSQPMNRTSSSAQPSFAPN